MEILGVWDLKCSSWLSRCVIKSLYIYIVDTSRSDVSDNDKEDDTEDDYADVEDFEDIEVSKSEHLCTSVCLYSA